MTTDPHPTPAGAATQPGRRRRRGVAAVVGVSLLLVVIMPALRLPSYVDAVTVSNRHVARGDRCRTARVPLDR